MLVLITPVDHACSDYSHWSCLISLFTMITLVLITHADHACSDYSHWSCLIIDPADGWHGRVLHPPLQRRHLQPRVRKEGEKLKNIYNFLVSLITKSQVFCSLYFRTLFYSCVSQHGNKNVKKEKQSQKHKVKFYHQRFSQWKILLLHPNCKLSEVKLYSKDSKPLQMFVN